MFTNCACRYHYHRREKTDTSFDPDHERFLDYLGKYLSYSSVDVKTFTPDLYVTVTWENVTDHDTATFNSSCTATVDEPCRVSACMCSLFVSLQQT